LKVVHANSALRLRAELDFKEGDVQRVAGDEWLFKGPGKNYFVVFAPYFLHSRILKAKFSWSPT